jgi:hypothetical protein
MGASLVYLEKPNKDIVFDEGEDSNVKFCAGSMQGWRINMVSSLLTRNVGCFQIRRGRQGNGWITLINSFSNVSNCFCRKMTI